VLRKVDPHTLAPIFTTTTTTTTSSTSSRSSSAGSDAGTGAGAGAGAGAGVVLCPGEAGVVVMEPLTAAMRVAKFELVGPFSSRAPNIATSAAHNHNHHQQQQQHLQQQQLYQQQQYAHHALSRFAVHDSLTGRVVAVGIVSDVYVGIDTAHCL
jgi:hypothetical protein